MVNVMEAIRSVLVEHATEEIVRDMYYDYWDSFLPTTGFEEFEYAEDMQEPDYNPCEHFIYRHERPYTWRELGLDNK